LLALARNMKLPKRIVKALFPGQTRKFVLDNGDRLF
jgi:hypothetical protein